jgi:hypothetical protein
MRNSYKLFQFKFSHILFLSLFTYVILCDFYPLPVQPNSTNLGLSISIPEIVLILWVLALFFDEIREVYIFDSFLKNLIFDKDISL